MKSSSTCDSRSRFSSSNALLPRFRRGDSTSGFAVNAIGPSTVAQRKLPGSGASAIIPVYGGYSSVAERRSVAADVVGSKPTSRPKTSQILSHCGPTLSRASQAIAFSQSSERVSYAGTSGWAYPTWKPDFYPAGTPAKRFLEFYASQLTSVEVNYTFRALPTAKMLEGWLAATPANFRFSFKAPQRITHFKRLARLRRATWLSSSPHSSPCDRRASLACSSSSFRPTSRPMPNASAASSLLQRFGRSSAPPIAFEFRHESWFTEEIYAILRAA